MHICPDTDSRAEVAAYVGELVYGIYQRGISHNRTIEQEIEGRDLKYGDRLALDAAFEIAQEDGKNYKKEDEKIPHGDFDVKKEQARTKRKREDELEI